MSRRGQWDEGTSFFLHDKQRPESNLSNTVKREPLTRGGGGGHSPGEAATLRC